MNTQTAVDAARAIGTDFEKFVNDNAAAFSGFDLDRVRRSVVAQTVHAMCVDVCRDPVTAELHAVSKVSMVMIEIDRELSPSQDYLDNPAQRLAPLHISGVEADQQRWLDALNLRQLRGWQGKGYGEYSSEIADLVLSVNESFDSETITRFDCLSVIEPGWIG